ncbi:hypothetical protein HZS_3020 [Henneguya salminicola]|nr:hypothetical protein HZS_3020 [Henneguya salminicola]
MESFENLNPTIYDSFYKRNEPSNEELDFNIIDEIDSQEIFELICYIKDPEHMDTTLEQLHIVRPNMISIDYTQKLIVVYFTPTIPNCSMSSLIGLCIKSMLIRCFPKYKVDVKIEPGTHLQELQINRQLADKERICAALEGEKLNKLINQCLNIDWDFRAPFTYIDKYNLL